MKKHVPMRVSYVFAHTLRRSVNRIKEKKKKQTERRIPKSERATEIRAV